MASSEQRAEQQQPCSLGGLTSRWQSRAGTKLPRLPGEWTTGTAPPVRLSQSRQFLSRLSRMEKCGSAEMSGTSARCRVPASPCKPTQASVARLGPAPGLASVAQLKRG